MREEHGNWGVYACRIVTKTTWRGAPRWRAVIDREFAGITETHTRLRWRRTEAEAAGGLDNGIRVPTLRYLKCGLKIGGKQITPHTLCGVIR